MVALGGESQLTQQVFGLLIRAIALPRCDEMLEVVVSQGISHRRVTLQLVSRVRGDDKQATRLRHFEPSRATSLDAAEQQEPISGQGLLLPVGQHSQLHIGTHREFVVWHTFVFRLSRFTASRRRARRVLNMGTKGSVSAHAFGWR